MQGSYLANLQVGPGIAIHKSVVAPEGEFWLAYEHLHEGNATLKIDPENLSVIETFQPEVYPTSLLTRESQDTNMLVYWNEGVNLGPSKDR